MLRQKESDWRSPPQLREVQSHRSQLSRSPQQHGVPMHPSHAGNSDTEVGTKPTRDYLYQSSAGAQKSPKSHGKLPSAYGYATDDTYDLEFLEELDQKKELIDDEIRRAERRIKDVVGIQIAPIRRIDHNYSGIRINQGAPKSTKKVIRTLQLPEEGSRALPPEERYHRDMAIMKQFSNLSYQRSQSTHLEYKPVSMEKNKWKDRAVSGNRQQMINRNASRDAITEPTEDGHMPKKESRLPSIQPGEKKRLEIMTTDDDNDLSPLGRPVLEKSFDYWKEDQHYRLVSAKKKARREQEGYTLKRIETSPTSPITRQVLRKDPSQKSRMTHMSQHSKSKSTDLVDWKDVEGGSISGKVEAAFRNRKGQLGQFMKELSLLSKNIEDLVVREHQLGMILHHEKTAQYLKIKYRGEQGNTTKVGDDSEDGGSRLGSVQAAFLKRALAAASRVDSV